MKNVSVSQVQMFTACSRKWYREYVLGIKPPRTAKSQAAMDLGSQIHSDIEAWVVHGVVQADPARKRFVDAATRLVGGPGQDPFELTLVEQEFILPTFPGGPGWVGYVDLVYPERQPPEIWDHKTVSNFKYRKARHELLQDLQLGVYAYAFFQGAVTPVACEPWRASEVLGGLHYIKTTVSNSGELETDTVQMAFSKSLVEDIWDKALFKVRKMVALHDNKPDWKSVDGNLASCDSYGGCPHRADCGAQAQQSPVKFSFAGFAGAGSSSSSSAKRSQVMGRFSSPAVSGNSGNSGNGASTQAPAPAPAAVPAVPLADVPWKVGDKGWWGTAGSPVTVLELLPDGQLRVLFDAQNTVAAVKVHALRKVAPLGEAPGGPHPKVPALAVPLGQAPTQLPLPLGQAPTQLPSHGQILPPDAPKDEHILPFKIGDKVMWTSPASPSRQETPPVEALVVAVDGMVVGIKVGETILVAQSKDCQPLAQAASASSTGTGPKKSRLRQKAEEAAGAGAVVVTGASVPEVIAATQEARASKYKIEELLIGCAPLRHPAGHDDNGVVLLEDWLAPVCARVAEQAGVGHFGLVDFGKGRSLLVVEILKEVSSGKLPKVIICDSAFGKQAEAAIEALTPFAAKIYRRLG